MTNNALHYLLVDDDPAFTQVLSRALERRGLHTSVAANLEQAVDLLDSNGFHRAVVDLKLAQQSGLQLLEHIRDHHPELPTVILTGYSSIATAVEAIKLGALNYLCKPASVDDILTAFSDTGSNPDSQIAATPPSVDRLEWEHIQRVLQENNGNISVTARLLGMHRRTLQRKLAKRPVRN